MSMTDALGPYFRSIFGQREELLDKVLRDALLVHRLPPLQVDDNAGRVLQLLTLIRRPRRAIEVGTLFGYSSIHIARGLPAFGQLTTLEIDKASAELARRNVEIAGVGHCVEVVVGPAEDYLAKVEPKSIGLIFIDGAKRSYPDYLKLCFPLLEPGGLLVADDAFARGNFARESDNGGNGTGEMRAINAYSRAVARSTSLFSAFVGTEQGLLVSFRA